jgi:hypothetical protein
MPNYLRKGEKNWWMDAQSKSITIGATEKEDEWKEAGGFY